MTATQNVRHPLAYMFRIVRNLAIDHYRRAMFETELFGIDEEGLNIPALSGSPETHAVNRQHIALIAQVLAKLPKGIKRVFQLYQIEGYNHQMISDELAISTLLVYSFMYEAMNHCRDAPQPCTKE